MPTPQHLKRCIPGALSYELRVVQCRLLAFITCFHWACEAHPPMSTSRGVQGFEAHPPMSTSRGVQGFEAHPPMSTSRGVQGFEAHPPMSTSRGVQGFEAHPPMSTSRGVQGFLFKMKSVTLYILWNTFTSRVDFYVAMAVQSQCLRCIFIPW